jgi:transcriptional regulator with XRE-family HTH domain
VSEIASPASTESLCVRLRRERERRHIALSSISANTKISVGLFESLERGDVSRWPSGIYRRSFIRAYAHAIGLDPDATAREFLEEFPDPLDPLDPPAAVDPAAATPAIVPAAPSAVAPAQPLAVPAAVPVARLRVRVADTGRRFVPGRLLTEMRQRALAAACDGGVVLAMALCGFIVFEKFWLPLGVAMLAYYLGGILVLGNTPGVCLLAIDPDSSPPYNHPADEPGPSPARGTASAPWHFRMPAR